MISRMAISSASSARQSDHRIRQITFLFPTTGKVGAGQVSGISLQARAKILRWENHRALPAIRINGYGCNVSAVTGSPRNSRCCPDYGKTCRATWLPGRCFPILAGYCRTAQLALILMIDTRIFGFFTILLYTPIHYLTIRWVERSSRLRLSGISSIP